jgi:predicted secreted protein
MTRYAGRSAGLYLGTGTSAVLVGNVKTTSLKIAGQPVDVTAMDDGGFRTLLSGAGEKSCDIGITGPVNDGTGFAQLMESCENNGTFLGEYRYGASRRVYGSFMIPDLTIEGNEKDAQSFSGNLQSAGTFVEGTTAS